MSQTKDARIKSQLEDGFFSEVVAGVETHYWAGRVCVLLPQKAPLLQDAQHPPHARNTGCGSRRRVAAPAAGIQSSSVNWLSTPAWGYSATLFYKHLPQRLSIPSTSPASPRRRDQQEPRPSPQGGGCCKSHLPISVPGLGHKGGYTILVMVAPPGQTLF